MRWSGEHRFGIELTMKRFYCTAAILALSAGILPAVAADASPVGDWMVKDGFGIIRVDNCNGKMWGILAWEKVASVDKENPDPAKRNRPALGILHMHHLAFLLGDIPAVLHFGLNSRE